MTLSGMNESQNPKLSANAKAPRTNLTKEERHLWYDFLKTLPVMVHRQKVIGQYIVDFYIASAKIVIELDGSQHFEPQGREADQIRDTYLQSLGLTVLRYSNADINQRFPEVCRDIWNRLPMTEEKPSP